MITIQECIRLLSSDWVSGFYVPQSYLAIDHIAHLICEYNWMILPSELAGWNVLRRRVAYQDSFRRYKKG